MVESPSAARPRSWHSSLGRVAKARWLTRRSGRRRWVRHSSRTVGPRCARPPGSRCVALPRSCGSTTPALRAYLGLTW